MVMTDTQPELAELIAPLPAQAGRNAAEEAANPLLCGTDLIFSMEFDQLNELRREEDASLDQGAWVTDVKRADWPAAMALTARLLTTQSKDLRLAAWWAESAAHVHSYGGLADGLLVYGGLCRQLWDDVHPLAESGDQELRIGSITWLLGQVRSLCRSLPVLTLGETQLNLGDIELARQRAVGSTPPPSAGAAAGRVTPPSMDMVTRALRATPAKTLLALVDGARRVPAALADLQVVIDERLGADGPGFASARDAVKAMLLAVERMAREAGALPPAGAGAGAESVVAGTATATATATESRLATAAGSGAGDGAGTPQSREQALAQLRSVAEFFRRTEPHSPVAYLVDRAARWGEMPLHEWLRTVLKEPGTLGQLEELLGVTPPPASSSS